MYPDNLHCKDLKVCSSQNRIFIIILESRSNYIFDGIFWLLSIRNNIYQICPLWYYNEQIVIDWQCVIYCIQKFVSWVKMLIWLIVYHRYNEKDIDRRAWIKTEKGQIMHEVVMQLNPKYITQKLPNTENQHDQSLLNFYMNV